MDNEERYQQEAASAIRALRREIRWKPGKDVQHLETRKGYGHLPAETTLNEYVEIIRNVLLDSASSVYHYPFSASNYYAVSGEFQSVAWLVMFSHDGIMETAFPPDDLADYLVTRRLFLLGGVKEIVDE